MLALTARTRFFFVGGGGGSGSINSGINRLELKSGDIGRHPKFTAPKQGARNERTELNGRLVCIFG